MMQGSERAERHFAEELDQLKRALLAMGGLAENRLRTAVAGLVERDQRRIDEVVYGDEELNAAHLDIDDRCFKLLALHQPMAVDLRTIVAAVKINSDLERVGDLAVNIAQAAARYVTYPPVKDLVDIPRMGTIAQSMLRDALDAFVSGNVTLAQSVLGRDDELDSLKTEVFRELMAIMLENAQTIQPALQLVLISRHLERVGDHATNISEDVIFIVAARDVRHRAETRAR
jgi:phosphate transport system protein